MNHHHHPSIHHPEAMTLHQSSRTFVLGGNLCDNTLFNHDYGGENQGLMMMMMMMMVMVHMLSKTLVSNQWCSMKSSSKDKLFSGDRCPVSNLQRHESISKISTDFRDRFSVTRVPFDAQFLFRSTPGGWQDLNRIATQSLTPFGNGQRL